jgi:hypothetical protein
VGPQGVAGATGARGATGAQGAVGLAGATGAQGPTGQQGNAGPTGARGLTGAAGARGPAGTIGLTGAQGPIGAMGPAGPTGHTGPTGPAGGPILFGNNTFASSTGSGLYYPLTGVNPAPVSNLQSSLVPIPAACANTQETTITVFQPPLGPEFPTEFFLNFVNSKQDPLFSDPIKFDQIKVCSLVGNAYTTSCSNSTSFATYMKAGDDLVGLEVAGNSPKGGTHFFITIACQ